MQKNDSKFKEKEIEIGEKIFSKGDQQNFAFFSGDFNPIHLDDSYARKLISGQCIVHGIHSLLWALEALFQKTGKIFYDIAVNFSKPIFLNETIKVIWNANKDQLILIKDKITLVSIQLSDEALCGHNFSEYTIPITQCIKRDPINLNISDIQVGQVFEFGFNGDVRFAKSMFPSLSKSIGIELVAQIASLSCVVGMQIPGLHSLFVKAKIHIKPQIGEQKVKVQKINKKFNMVVLSCCAKNMLAHLEVLFRPTPIALPSCNILRLELEKIDLHHVKALIIGGSRGLGAWTAKIISLLGGEVTLTYNIGKNDAEQMQLDINNAGGKCNITKLSINRNFSLKLPPGKFNQIYYFATPKIFGKRNKDFDSSLYDDFFLFYVESFQYLVEQAVERGVTDILYPSTAAIDVPIIELEEYIKAKNEGEKFCTSFAAQNSIRIHMPRIPRALTDQTTSILPVYNEHPLRIMIPIIQQMSLKKHS